MNMDRETTIASESTGEFVPYTDHRRHCVRTTPSMSPGRTHSSPLMGKSARAAKRRFDAETRPTRIDGIDTYSLPPQHHYQNVGHGANDSEPLNFNAKRDFFEQRFKPAAPTYDSPPREQRPLSPKIVTTITTTTTGPAQLLKRTSLPSTESAPSFDRLIEQAAELQKRTQDTPNPNNSQQSLVIERKEQCQVYFDRTNHDPQQVSPSPVRNAGHATDLDQAQANRLTDDHQAIQQLTRVLQGHQPAAANQYKRVSSPASPILFNTTTTTTTTIPADLALPDRAQKATGSEFTVIDALLDNPVGTTNSKQNDTLHKRFNNIISNLQNADYVSVLRRSLTRDSRRKKSLKASEQPESGNPLASEQAPLLDPKQEKKSKKRGKSKSKKPEYTNYQVIDAIINSPIILRLPETFLKKYNVRPPASQLFPTPSLSARDTNGRLQAQPVDPQSKRGTDYNLVNVVDEMMSHHTTALNSPATAGFHVRPQAVRPHQYTDVIRSQRPGSSTWQSEAPVKPRIIYRYIDERGNILKYSSVPPSQLRETVSNQLPPSGRQNLEPKYFHNRQIVRESPRHHSTANRRTWQDQTEYSSVKRDESDPYERRRSHWSEKSSPTYRAIPISIERDNVVRRQHSLQQRHPPHVSESNVKLAWMPLSSQLDQPYRPDAAPGYDSDSSTSDHSTTYRTYDYKSVAAQHSSRPHFRYDYYQDRSPSPTYDATAVHLSHDNRARSPDYSSANISRNYIEVFRDGAANPSEVYSLPLAEPIKKARRHSRFDKHQAEKSSHRRVSSLSKHQKAIPSSSSSNHDSHYSQATRSSPDRDVLYSDNAVSSSKSFDYRPLRTKLSREYKITPSLLVDEWDHPETSPTSPYKTASVSSPDDVFVKTNRSYKA